MSSSVGSHHKEHKMAQNGVERKETGRPKKNPGEGQDLSEIGKRGQGSIMRSLQRDRKNIKLELGYESQE